MSKTKKERRTFELSGLDLVKNRQPLTSWSVARLFYGVPRWAKYAMRKVDGGILFSDKPL